MRSLIAGVVLMGMIMGCSSKQTTGGSELKAFAIDGSEHALTETGVTFDAAESADGNGSLKLEATEATTFRLFEVTDVDIDNARLFYRAKLKTDNVAGKAYLEMWCVFPEYGEFFSRGLEAPLTGTVDWTGAETPFMLEAGQKPSAVRLNVVVEGPGTVWVDDIRLASGPLK